MRSRLEGKIPLEEVIPWVRGRVRPERYRHIQGVVRTAKRLASRHGLSLEKAELAAWFHDCAKEETRAGMAALLRGTPFRMDAWERKIPALWHPHAGAAAAWKVWGLRDRETLEAIRCHTLGQRRMGPLARALFVADYIEPGRDFPGVREARRRAGRSLREGVLAKCEGTLRHLITHGMAVHPRLLETWNETLLEKP